MKNNSIVLVIIFFITFIAETIFPKIKPTIHFLNKFEYIPIITANIYADLFIIFTTFNNIFYKSKYLDLWYKKYRLSAMIADILIGVLYILLARYLVYKFKINVSLTGFALLSVGVQVVFDYLFYLFFMSVPMGSNKMLDFFKDYSKEVSYNALIGDSFLVVLAVLLSAILNTYSFDVNIVALIISIYLVPYFIYMKD